MNHKEISLPQEESFNEIASSSDDSVSTTITTKETQVTSSKELELPINNIIKQETNLKVPFTIQSPDQKWDENYKEGCEEASILMIYSFLNNKNITVDSAMKDIGDMINLQKQNFGGQFNLSATTTAHLANQFFGLKSEIVILKSIEDVKRTLSNGNPLIIPTLGRELKNPNFKNPGPIYHMLVIKGYTKNGEIITNDPGTRKGRDYLYNSYILFNAIGDWDYSIQSPNSNIKVGIILR